MILGALKLEQSLDLITNRKFTAITKCAPDSRGVMRLAWCHVEEQVFACVNQRHNPYVVAISLHFSNFQASLGVLATQKWQVILSDSQ